MPETVKPATWPRTRTRDGLACAGGVEGDAAELLLAAGVGVGDAGLAGGGLVDGLAGGDGLDGDHVDDLGLVGEAGRRPGRRLGRCLPLVCYLLIGSLDMAGPGFRVVLIGPAGVLCRSRMVATLIGRADYALHRPAQCYAAYSLTRGAPGLGGLGGWGLGRLARRGVPERVAGGLEQVGPLVGQGFDGLGCAGDCAVVVRPGRRTGRRG